MEENLGLRSGVKRQEASTTQIEYFSLLLFKAIG